MINKALEGGIEYLYKSQNPNGSFIAKKQKPSIFSTAIILNCLNTLNYQEPKLKQLKNRATKYLLKQKNKDGSFNYWGKNSKESKKEPYPNDLDDTFCSLIALFKNKPQLFDGKVLAKITNLLILNETKEGGPYKTWLTTDKKWDNVDLVVNINIARFLNLIDVQLPYLNEYTKTGLRAHKFKSPYYVTEYPTIYFASEIYKESYLKNYLLRKMDKFGRWKNPLHTALATTALINLGADPKRIEKSINYLIKNQKHGKWNSYPFVIEKIKDKKTRYLESPELTTAFCIETLDKYVRHENLIKPNLVQEKTPIFDLPNIFAKALDAKIPKETLVKLGEATQHGWKAYTIYDNIIDEKKDIKLLFTANKHLRELTKTFVTIAPNTQFPNTFTEIMDSMDGAILKNDSKNKSLGHILAPLAILSILGYNKDAVETKHTIKFFEHYLEAKQLNDDAHDWEKDLEQNQMTWVLEEIIKDAKTKTDIPTLQKVFWEKTILRVCSKIGTNLDKAQYHLQKNEAIKNPQYLEELLKPYYKAVKTTLSEQKKVLDFIKTYT